jgi:integrase
LVPQALFRVPSLKQPDTLPKFLTDEQVRLLRDDLEDRVERAGTPSQQRDALLDRAAFYLLWQGGLRLGEVEELELDDLDLPNRRLMVRKGKGLRDRTAYLTGKAVEAMRAYLDVRGMGPTNHLFLYRNEPLSKDLVRDRVKAAGQRTGVNVYPHGLRHTCATQLLNAGCRVTSIQKFLGHKRLNSTMIYARVHDRTVAEDYYAAMEVVEKRLEVALKEKKDHDDPPVNGDERAHLLDLAMQLAEPNLSIGMRLDLVDQMCLVLSHKTLLKEKLSMQEDKRRRPQVPP